LHYIDRCPLDAKLGAPFDLPGEMQRLGLAKPMVGNDAAAGDIVATPRDRRRARGGAAHSSVPASV
jgi:hypothetical protein